MRKDLLKEDYIVFDSVSQPGQHSQHAEGGFELSTFNGHPPHFSDSQSHMLSASWAVRELANEARSIMWAMAGNNVAMLGAFLHCNLEDFLRLSVRSGGIYQ